MLHVVFAIPFCKENTLRFARAVLELPGVRMSVVSQDPEQRFPAELRSTWAGFARVADAMHSDSLQAGVVELGAKVASVDRLIGILEPLQEVLAEVRQRLRIRGMAAQTARNFRDKAHMKDLFAQHGIGCAKHGLAESPAQALQVAASIGFPLVVKPPAGAGAKATVRCANRAELDRALRSMPVTPQQPLLLEEFVQGREFSFDTLSLHGQPVFHNICSYLPTPLQVLENDWIQWCVVLPRDLNQPEFAPIFRDGPAALRALGMWTGMTHMEWFLRADGSIAIGEVAARPPGAQFMTLMSYAQDRDMYRAFAELLTLETFTPSERRYSAGAAYLRAPAKGRIARVVGWEALQRELGAAVVEVNLPKIGAMTSDSYEGDGAIVVRHPETQFVLDATQRIVANVRVETS